ncbi:helix-turn-helix domain-containing protein [Catenuloplanes indicus]|nr:helix-turn-helix transcriptional regulator [Catenuloplanes indicus]
MTEEAPTLGEILRTAREAVGWSLSRMGQATGFSKPYLSKLETGEKEVKSWHIDAYDKALGGDSVRRRALLKMGAGLVSQAVWSELEIPAATPTRFDPPDLGALDASVDMLTSLGLKHGGKAAAAAARGQLRYAAALLDMDMPDKIRESLLTTVGRLADRTAWSMADTGQLGRASRIYDFALLLTPDSAQRWLTLVNLASLRLDEASPQQALNLLDRAEPDVPVLRFLLMSTRANAYAQLGDFSRTIRCIGEADEAHDAVNLSDLPAAVRPYASGHDAHAHAAGGKALYVLARGGHRKAAPLAGRRLEAAIDAFGAERARAITSCRDRLSRLA